jgi:hypothetical protein
MIAHQIEKQFYHSPILRNDDYNYFSRIIHSLESLLVLRIIHLLLEITYFHFIVEVISRTLSSFVVVASLFIFSLIIYALFGIQLFKGRFDINTLEGQEKNFETIWWAFVSALKVSIFDDSYVFVMLGEKDPGPVISFLYVLLGKLIFSFYNKIVLNIQFLFGKKLELEQILKLLLFKYTSSCFKHKLFC